MVGDWIAGRACAGAGTSHSVLPAFGSRQARELDSDSAGPGSSLGKAAWVEIIREFCDAGRSGLNSEGRPAFTEMMDEWITKRYDFDYVLCLDVSRWGRFQDIDLSAQFSAICKKHKKQVIYTTIGKPKEDDPALSRLCAVRAFPRRTI